MESIEVREGDTITSVAFRFGFFPETLWQHPSNSVLRSLRTDGDILMPGDVMNVPPIRIRPHLAPVNHRYRFRRKGVPARMRMQIFDENGPRASQSFVLSIDARELPGTTDGDGVIEAFIPPDAVRGELMIGPDRKTYTILFGTLDPITEIIGVQKRLNNIGFYCGEETGEMNDATAEALRRFQFRAQLPVTGHLDDTSRNMLAKIHDRRGAFPNQAGS
jgi:N-acetylmuramoyl-L-alanine amidase